MTDLPKLILIDETGRGAAKSDLAKGLNQIIDWAKGQAVSVHVQVYDAFHNATITELQEAIMGNLHGYIIAHYKLRRHQTFKTGSRGELMIVTAEVVGRTKKTRNKLRHLTPAKKKRK